MGVTVAGSGANLDGASHMVYDNRILEPGFESMQAKQKSKFVILDNIFYLSVINHEGSKIVDTKRHSLFEDDRELNYIVIQPNDVIQQLDENDYEKYVKGK